uniref:Uncharacterized protein n=1 Tax=Capnocytophaga canimorsus TaxID=28188 RepID=A0A1X7BZ20_9FLAO|nr:hypothetical protein CC4__530060 [Capnocytophaga canimorsus]
MILGILKILKPNYRLEKEKFNGESKILTMRLYGEAGTILRILKGRRVYGRAYN